MGKGERRVGGKKGVGEEGREERGAREVEDRMIQEGREREEDEVGDMLD